MTCVINRRDLDFLLFEWLQLPELLRRERYAKHDSSSIAAMLDVTQQIAGESLAANLRASDIREPALTAQGDVKVLPEVAHSVQLIKESGLFGAVFSEELGGLELPNAVYLAALGMLMSGSIAMASYVLLTVANARLIAGFGTEAQIDAFARPQVSGDSFGTMCLSESAAGSSLADIRTRADADGEDALGKRFRITGAKMWISGGDQDITENIIHLVLAKVPGADGKLPLDSRGISLFIVPKRLPDGSRNDLVVAGLNHKMGYRGIPNCALNLGEGTFRPEGKAGAIGWLVGAEGQGLAQMFHMMNEARVSVGLGGAMLAYRGYLMALDYARNRRQGRRPGQRGSEPIAIIEHPDVKRMLLAQKAYAEGALALVLWSARLLDDQTTAPQFEQREEAAELLGLVTPVTKTFPSELAQHSLHLAIQVYGGAGYTRDHEIEQLYRDNRLNPIHEGTTGIQAIDLVGRKLRRDGGRRMRLLRARVAKTVAAVDKVPQLQAPAVALEAAWKNIDRACAVLLGEADEARALANATPFLFALGHAIVGWLWLDQAIVAAQGLSSGGAAERNFRQGKINACRYFSEFHVPEIDAWLNPILIGTDVTSTMPVSQFLGEET